MAEKLPELPEMVYSVIKQAEAGQLEMQWHSNQLQSIKDEIGRANRRTILAVLPAATLILFGLVLLR